LAESLDAALDHIETPADFPPVAFLNSIDRTWTGLAASNFGHSVHDGVAGSPGSVAPFQEQLVCGRIEKKQRPLRAK
jgi:hypothetical protein